MEEDSSKRDVLLKKLKEIGDLSIINCSHPHDEISHNARSINRLARDCFEMIRRNID